MYCPEKREVKRVIAVFRWRKGGDGRDGRSKWSPHSLGHKMMDGLILQQERPGQSWNQDVDEVRCVHSGQNPTLLISKQVHHLESKFTECAV